MHFLDELDVLAELKRDPQALGEVAAAGVAAQLVVPGPATARLGRLWRDAPPLEDAGQATRQNLRQNQGDLDDFVPIGKVQRWRVVAGSILWARTVTEEWVRQAARAYAERLLSSCKGSRCLIGTMVQGLHVHPAGSGGGVESSSGEGADAPSLVRLIAALGRPRMPRMREVARPGDTVVGVEVRGFEALVVRR